MHIDELIREVRDMRKELDLAHRRITQTMDELCKMQHISAHPLFVCQPGPAVPTLEDFEAIVNANNGA